MSITSNGRHSAPSAGFWSRKSKAGKVAVITLALMVLAGAAFALMSMFKTTAAENFSVKTIGAVNIGNAEQDGLFTGATFTFEPGQNVVGCLIARVTNQAAGETSKYYAGAVTGDLADDLTIKIERFTHNLESQFPTSTGQIDCATFQGSTNGTWATVYEGTVADFKATKGTFANGFGMGAKVLNRYTIGLPSAANAAAITGQTATVSVVYENQG